MDRPHDLRTCNPKGNYLQSKLKGVEPISREMRPGVDGSLLSKNKDCTVSGDGFCDTLADPTGLQFDLKLQSSEGKEEKLNMKWGCGWAYCDVAGPGLGGHKAFTNISKEELKNKGLETALVNAIDNKRKQLIANYKGKFNDKSRIYIKSHVYDQEGNLRVNLCGTPLFCLMTPPSECEQYHESKTVSIQGKTYKKCIQWKADVCNASGDQEMDVAYDRFDNLCRAKVDRKASYSCDYRKPLKGFSYIWPSTPPPNAILKTVLNNKKFKASKFPAKVQSKIKDLSEDPSRSGIIHFNPIGMGGENIMSYSEPVKSIGSIVGESYKAFSKMQKKWINIEANSGERFNLGSLQPDGRCKVAVKGFRVEKINKYKDGKFYLMVAKKDWVHYFNHDFKIDYYGSKGPEIAVKKHLNNNTTTFYWNQKWTRPFVISAYSYIPCATNLKRVKKKSEKNIEALSKSLKTYESKVEGQREVNCNQDEVCDKIDNDCDGKIDEGVIKTFYEDRDGDGYGTSKKRQLCQVEEAFTALKSRDCKDNDKKIHPGAKEVCDGKDNNCNGKIDEGLLISFYEDRDGDGYGTSKKKILCKAKGVFRAKKTGDCNDRLKFIYPGARESSNDKYDSNCNGASCRAIKTNKCKRRSWGVCVAYKYNYNLYLKGKYSDSCGYRSNECSDHKKSCTFRYSCSSYKVCIRRSWGVCKRYETRYKLYRNGIFNKNCGTRACNAKRGSCR